MKIVEYVKSGLLIALAVLAVLHVIAAALILFNII